MSNVRVVDTLTDGNSSTLALTSGPTNSYLETRLV